MPLGSAGIMRGLWRRVAKPEPPRRGPTLADMSFRSLSALLDSDGVTNVEHGDLDGDGDGDEHRDRDEHGDVVPAGRRAGLPRPTPGSGLAGASSPKSAGFAAFYDKDEERLPGWEGFAVFTGDNEGAVHRCDHSVAQHL